MGVKQGEHPYREGCALENSFLWQFLEFQVLEDVWLETCAYLGCEVKLAYEQKCHEIHQHTISLTSVYKTIRKYRNFN